MRYSIPLACAMLTLAACDASPPVDNAAVPHEAVCDNSVGDNCVEPDPNLPAQDQNVIEANGDKGDVRVP